MKFLVQISFNQNPEPLQINAYNSLFLYYFIIYYVKIETYTSFRLEFYFSSNSDPTCRKIDPDLRRPHAKKRIMIHHNAE